jgi:hypothetical protein
LSKDSFKNPEKNAVQVEGEEYDLEYMNALSALTHNLPPTIMVYASHSVVTEEL